MTSTTQHARRNPIAEKVAVDVLKGPIADLAAAY